ncbi:beta-glucosidase 22-like isoform X2 [Actinidia eriantha]|uniref:beta-glucosidase 22-like isoform X2 n=1 Tax=Actinidia eriantha TaxID=165200 RepID=UPI0025848328|nr:beta-glucosidase 22-like isoform X2 [Actinidia eriantha]
MLLIGAMMEETYTMDEGGFQIGRRQQGFIGININVSWYGPCTNPTEDVIATQQAIDFYVGWFVDPLVFGDWADIMKKNAGTRIPAFTELESKQVKDSFDFIGVNDYTTLYVKEKTSSLKMDSRDLNADSAIQMIFDQGDTPPPPGEVSAKEKSHEVGQRADHNTTRQGTGRVKHMHGYIGALLDAVRNGLNARGYFSWTCFSYWMASNPVMACTTWIWIARI